MSDIIQFRRKTAASKGRVSALAADAIHYLNKTQREEEAKQEKARVRKMVMDDLEMAIKKAFAVLGPIDAQFAISLVFEGAKPKVE